MIEQELTTRQLEKLTPRDLAKRFGLSELEIKVLRERFGITEKSNPLPPREDEDNGSGGVPAAAKPLN